MADPRLRAQASKTVPQAAPPKQVIDFDPCMSCNVREMSVCADLTPDELEHLATIVSDQKADTGHAIFSEGDDAGSLFNVTGGVVKLYKLLPDGRRQITGFLFPGDFLGLAVNDQYGYSAEAVEPVRLCRFPRQPLERIMERYPHMKARLFTMASNELAAAQDQMLLLGRKTARERIASFLLQLQGSAKRRGQPANPIRLPMNRGDIADFLGLTTETVSRTISAMKRSGVIALREGGNVDVRDQTGLDAIAAGETVEA